MTNEIKEKLEAKVLEFNSRINDEPSFSKKIEGKNRSICICITDGGNYSTKLDNLEIESFKETEDPTADVVVTASSEIIIALLQKNIHPIKAYMSGDLKVKASIMDMLLLKGLF
jgi:putative sterol carrier protein|tara:strand:+ start:3952 stop:4293 length:342 start_codon:yes stop_codon:yes gene_type:complete